MSEAFARAFGWVVAFIAAPWLTVYFLVELALHFFHVPHWH